MNDLLTACKPRIQLLQDEMYGRKRIKVFMLRLDEIHPVISGNKIFKLYYFLQEAITSSHKRIITFGGAYSNHLAATAYACAVEKIQCIGMVRGEQPAVLSPTLLFCLKKGMQLQFISRANYRTVNNEQFHYNLTEKYGGHILIPEGGFALKGAMGAEKIMALFEQQQYSHVCCAVGTATTFAGLINGASGSLKITGYSVLKNVDDIEARLITLKAYRPERYTFNNDYHFGGYAKKNDALLNFMNKFYEYNKIALDFVYTGKMMFGVNELISKNYFSAGSTILCIHTGGLQGNQSLPEGALNF